MTAPAAGPRRSGPPQRKASHRWLDTIEMYRQHLKASGCTHQTVEQRAYVLRRLSWDFRNRRPQDVRTQDLVSWMAEQGWGPSSLRNARMVFRGYFAWMRDTGLCKASPAAALPAVRPPRNRPRPAPDTAVTLGLASEDERVRLAVGLLYLTGIRRDECVRVHTSDVQASPGGHWLVVRGKGGHFRHVPLPADLAAQLLGLPAGFVFPGNTDGHLSAQHLGKLISRALGPGWAAHSLRHRYASTIYARCHDIRAVQELLGHAKADTTAAYTLVMPEQLRAAADHARIAPDPVRP